MAELQSPLGVVDLTNGARIVFEAIDPATGAQVGGVLVSNVAITYRPDDVTAIPSLLPKPLLIRASSG